MNKRQIAYWITTALASLAFFAGGFSDLFGAAAVVEGLRHLGYPAYFATILGVWKVLGAAALLAPVPPRLKEWAYAGMFFDLTGAAASHAFVGDGAGPVLTPLVVLGLVMASWALRPSQASAPVAAASEQRASGLAARAV